MAVGARGGHPPRLRAIRKAQVSERSDLDARKTKGSTCRMFTPSFSNPRSVSIRC